MEKHIPNQTKSSTKRGLNIFKAWSIFRKYPVSVFLELTLDEMEVRLREFLPEASKKNGQPYPAETIYHIVVALDRALRENSAHNPQKNSTITSTDGEYQSSLPVQSVCRPYVSILNNEQFAAVRITLDATMKARTEKGVGCLAKQERKKKHDAMTGEEVRKVAATCDISTPKGLQRRVFLQNGIKFGVRGNQSITCLISKISKSKFARKKK